MSTMPNSTNRPFRQRWTEFWFAPGDPTTLGFIRIVTGLLILYLHLAYSLFRRTPSADTSSPSSVFNRQQRIEAGPGSGE